uniref:Cuticle protein 6 n=1 Tax=Lygus hesperus TaxID=30085 RepID=A0A0A9W1G0_LYGHE
MKRFCVLLLAVGLAQGGQVALEHVGQITSQYHSQDELGQYSYGYAGGPSAKEEIKTADGITRGGYSYIDANGIVQSASYVSDPVNGFRVAATNLPAGPAVPAGPSVVAAAPAVVAAPAPVLAAAPAPIVASAPVWAAQPAVVAAPAPVAVAEGPAVTATNVQEVAAAAADVPVAADLPEIIAARSLPTVVATRAAIAHPLAATSWSGIVHHLKKRSLAAATVVTPLTSYPGSTAPLVHASPVIAATPVISAHSGLIATDSLVASPHLVGVGPVEPLHTAILRQAHEVTKAQEALRNTAGVIPLNSPADTPDVEITKVNHVLQVAAEGQRNTLGGVPVISSHPVIAHL